MCGVFDVDDYYRIAYLVHELGILHDRKNQARTDEGQRQMAAECRRISSQLIHIERGLKQEGMLKSR